MNKVCNIVMKPNEPSQIIYSDGSKEYSKCLNCKNKKCMYYKVEELTSDKVRIPTNITKNVCPVDAITFCDGKIIIQHDKCIKCGLCVSRCINGSIYMDENNYPVVNIGSTNLSESDFTGIDKVGTYVNESDEVMNYVYEGILKNNVDPNTFSRNLLNQCGIKTILSRKGDVNLRMDAVIINQENVGVCEIEFGNDVLSCPRCLLDDIAVMCSRYEYEMKDLFALVISFGLPNNRTDFWRVIKDIKNVTTISIQTFSIGSLLLLVWNNMKVDLLNNEFYLDCDDNSLKNKISVLLNRKVNIVEDKFSILDTNK